MNNTYIPLGATLIANEREEQLTKHGYSIENDVKHNTNYQLSEGAIALLEPKHLEGNYPHKWNEDTFIKMISKPYKERLIIAGALIAAEIDRLLALETK